MRLFSPIENTAELRGIVTRPLVIEAILEMQERDEPLSIDELINGALDNCSALPDSYNTYKQQIQELHSRLALGRLHLAVVGEFNRGKSTFINGMIGMKLLPTSVLPITAVPTRIMYGPDLHCTVRFLNKPELLVRSSRENITATLRHYVAEDGNPNNRYGVDSVEIVVPSPLLENGTVLIDTPGFGSTYLHNTKTALDALRDCDAALFLLSVDPPMTQTEVEFLKQIIRHVPRIFFILNKVDLLTSPQLERVNRFIVHHLKAYLRDVDNPHLFNICARHAENASDQSDKDPRWAASGMESVKNDIIEFMAREKYFTLSQALNDKLKMAVNSILSLLRKEKDDLEAPLGQLTREREALRIEREKVEKALEKELALISAEKKAVLKFLGEQISAGKLKLVSQVHDALKILLEGSSCSADSLKSVTAALNSILPEALSHFLARLLGSCNRPLKKAMALHAKEFLARAESVRTALSGLGDPPSNTLQEKLETLELEADRLPPAPEPQAPLTIALQWNDLPFNRQKKIQRLHERFDYKLDELLQNRFLSLTQQVRSGIDALFTTLTELLTGEYKSLSDQLESIMKRKGSAVVGSVDRINRAATELTGSIESFQRIFRQLR